MSFGASQPSNPLSGFRFTVTLGPSASIGAASLGTGIVPFQAGFSEVSGLGATIDIHTYEEGGRNDRTLKFASRADYGNITLRRGVALGRELFDWYDAVRRGSFGARRTLNIAHLDERGDAQLIWTIFRALPAGYVGPTWDASQNSVAIEALEIAHEGIELIPGSELALESAVGGR
ncbi:MAG: phage tail protein [Myxococcota bacterium]